MQLQELADLVDRLVRHVLRHAARPDVRVVHPQAGDHLEDVEDVLPLAEAVQHHRDRAQLHAGGGQPDQVRGDPVELHHQHPDGVGPLGDLVGDAEQLLHRQAVRRLVEDRRQVVHPGHERGALGPVAVLEVLLDAGVQVADDRAGLGDRLALELQDQPQHAVRGRVLRAHVDDDPLVVDRVGARRRRVSQSPPVTVKTRPSVVSRVGGVVRRASLVDSSARPAAGSRRPCTPPGRRRAGSPCAAGGPPSRPASGSGSGRGGRRRRCRTCRTSPAPASRRSGRSR